MLMRLVLLAACSSNIASAFDSIPASSRLGSGLLSKARQLNNNNNNDDGYDFTWVADYSIQFHSCHTTLAFRADGGREEEQDGAPTESMRLVYFKLCPTNSCGSLCLHGADYVVEMREFVESYLEFDMTQKEYNCEKVKDNCVCNDDQLDEESCEELCYQNAGLDYCSNNNNNNNNDDDFELDRYLECEALNRDDDSSQTLYVGAYCSNSGKGIFLGTFTDRQCTKKASNGAYESYTGKSLPFTSTSIVSSNCISCKEPSEYNDDAYNADQQDADQVREICEDLYERSAKCESSLQGVSQKSTGGCNYIHKLLPQAERMAKNRAAPGTVFAWIFFFTTLLLGAYAFLLWRKLKRSSGSVFLEVQGEGEKA
jgi:hypothetical protein